VDTWDREVIGDIGCESLDADARFSKSETKRPQMFSTRILRLPSVVVSRVDAADPNWTRTSLAAVESIAIRSTWKFKEEDELWPSFDGSEVSIGE
jgi:hypothetical protein